MKWVMWELVSEKHHSCSCPQYGAWTNLWVLQQFHVDKFRQSYTVDITQLQQTQTLSPNPRLPPLYDDLLPLRFPSVPILHPLEVIFRLCSLLQLQSALCSLASEPTPSCQPVPRLFMSRGGSPNGQGREDGKGRYSFFLMEVMSAGDLEKKTHWPSRHRWSTEHLACKSHHCARQRMKNWNLWWTPASSCFRALQVFAGTYLPHL